MTTIKPLGFECSLNGVPYMTLLVYSYSEAYTLIKEYSNERFTITMTKDRRKEPRTKISMGKAE